MLKLMLLIMKFLNSASNKNYRRAECTNFYIPIPLLSLDAVGAVEAVDSVGSVAVVVVVVWAHSDANKMSNTTANIFCNTSEQLILLTKLQTDLI